MGRIEYREGIIYYGGSRAGTELETVILVLSATGRKTVSETCDLLNQLMQSFDDTMASLKDIMEGIGGLLEGITRYLRILQGQEDTARQQD